MNKLSLVIGLSTLLCTGFSFATSPTPAQPPSKAMTEAKQEVLTPAKALNMLKQGNQRFTNDKMRDYNFVKEMKVTTKKGQHPLAVILSCIDSRSIPEFLFDQGLGNLFVSRVAGNVVNQDLLGSMEFATQVAGSRLVLVMGHTHCGAVHAACGIGPNTGMANLDVLLKQITPAVKQVKEQSADGKFTCKNPQTVDIIAKQNVINQLNDVYNKSAVIKKLADAKQIQLVGAMHDLKTGQVSFFDNKGKSL